MKPMLKGLDNETQLLVSVGAAVAAGCIPVLFDGFGKQGRCIHPLGQGQPDEKTAGRLSESDPCRQFAVQCGTHGLHAVRLGLPEKRKVFTGQPQLQRAAHDAGDEGVQPASAVEQAALKA